MTATTAEDPSGVEYYFECTAGGGNDSDWQDSEIYEDTDLSPGTTYTYQVKARDKSAEHLETDWSTKKSATTTGSGDSTMHVGSIGMEGPITTKIAGPNTFTKARATVTIVDATDNPVKGATVYGSWSGDTSGTDSGLTDVSGNVTFESEQVKNGTTFTFTVTDVTKSGWIYEYDPAEPPSGSIPSDE